MLHIADSGTTEIASHRKHGSNDVTMVQDSRSSKVQASNEVKTKQGVPNVNKSCLVNQREFK
jgi:hypothetical protein